MPIKNCLQNLSYMESEAIFPMVGERCRSLFSVKAQIYACETQWRKKYCGILCIIKDHIRRSYFCRMYCLKVNKMIWEQEICNDLKIEAIRPFLLEFEGKVSEILSKFDFWTFSPVCYLHN